MSISSLASMYNSIPKISTSAATSTSTIPSITSTETETDSTSFASMLSEALGNTAATDFNAKLADLNAITGESDDLHDVLIAGQKADIMLNLTVQIRNKMVESYQEIMRMQI